MTKKTNKTENIIVTIEKANDKNHAFIKSNALAIMEIANTVYAPKIGDEKMGSDDYREWLFANHKELATYLFDDMGKPNKKGESKPIMSPHKKNIFAGIKSVATKNSEFLAWSESDIGNEVSSLAKITASINKYEKSLEPKTETESEGETESESEGEGEGESLTIEKPTLETVAKELLKKFSKDDCVKLSQMLYDLACEDVSDDAIQNVG